MNQKITNQNIVWHEPTVYRQDREKMNGHKSCILWFTGLSGSGKSTLAHAVEDYLHKRKIRTFVLDGDNVRRGLCKDLGFSDTDRTENIRRIGEVSKLFMQAGIISLTAFISPFIKDRQIVRKLVDTGEFIEIFCDASLEVCESRDVKGLYKKAISSAGWHCLHTAGVAGSIPASPTMKHGPITQDCETASAIILSSFCVIVLRDLVFLASKW